MPVPGQIERYLVEARRRLVDTGRRNKLVHTARDAKRSSSINISCDVDDICGRLKEHKEKLSFASSNNQGLPVTVGETMLNQGRLPTPDGDLKTSLSPEVLQRRLLKLYREAKTAEEEQGANILFLALGFLRWFESPSSEELCEAPLVLLPVSLVRERSSSQFKLVARDDDLNTNIALQERLREIGIELPEIGDDENLLPSEYFQRVNQATAPEPRWSLDSTGAQLGFFSFSKFLMLRDLFPETWSENGLVDHPLIRALLRDGFGREDSLYPDDVKLDEVFDPGELFQVVDADASQAVVIETVRRGKNLVVQGPPGTGKSQTITNIVAAAVNDGKRVLFLSEKRAALDVVFKNLCNAGLQNICFELHSRKANKREVIQEIERTLNETTDRRGVLDEVNQLRQIRNQLNSDAKRLNTVVGTTGITPYYALGKQVEYTTQNLPLPKIDIPELTTWHQTIFKDALLKVRALCEAITQFGVLKDHPWRGVQNLMLQPLERQRLLQKIELLSETAASLDRSMQALANVLECSPNITIGELYDFIDFFRRVAKRPSLSNEVLMAALHCKDKDRLMHIGLTGGKFIDAYRDIEIRFRKEIWVADLEPIRSAMFDGAQSWIARMGPKYRRQSKVLKSLLKQTLPKRAIDRLTLVDSAQHARHLRSQIAQDENFANEVLGSLWQGFRTDFEALFSAAGWSKLVAPRPNGVTSNGCLNLGQSPSKLLKLTDQFEGAVKQGISAFAELIEALQVDLKSAFGVKAIADVPLSDLRARSEAWLTSADRFEDWTRLKLSYEAVCEVGLAALSDRLAKGDLAPNLGESELEFARSEAVWSQAVRLDPRLATLDGNKRTQLVSEFQKLETNRQKFCAEAVLLKHLAGLPRSGDPGMSILRGQMARKRGHMPIRQLVQNAGMAIQRSKPVFLMSPISIAQFLPPGAIEFDLLVIDEASQVRPEDALGAVARVKQIVVVGDSKQLPPTAFFDRLVDDEEFDEDADDASSSGIPQPIGLESILTLSSAQGMPNKMLTWHYRSRHPSLIQVSNELFYNNKLFFPPTPKLGAAVEGLITHYVKGRYDRGASRTNEIEAREVIKAIRHHAETSPEISLGVVTFSISQKELIENLLELERRQSFALESFLQTSGPQDFFVKNLETVQGDERDVIFVSVGYGPSIAGAGLDSMAFGPVSAEGGERRLNVLFTRAKLRCEIFVSFRSGDIDLQRTTKEGPRALKHFLYFAETGISELPLPTGGDPDSPFEEDVQRAIAELGYVADPQVGTAGFRIDLAVRDLTSTRYLIAVECDGATYHRARWARERDRLRQAVLEQFGWKFHRIWSTDWFKNRNREIRKLGEAIKSAEGNLPPSSPNARGASSPSSRYREKFGREISLN